MGQASYRVERALDVVSALSSSLPLSVAVVNDAPKRFVWIKGHTTIGSWWSSKGRAKRDPFDHLIFFSLFS